MNAYTQQLTLKRFINQRVRISQREEGTKLSSGAVVVISTYKNKQVVRTFFEVEPRYLKPI